MPHGPDVPNLFDALEPEAPQRLDLPDAEILFWPAFFSPAESDAFLAALRDQVPWKQEQIKLYGKHIDLPRLTAWYGEPGKSYSYSGITVQSAPWLPTLLQIKQALEKVSAVTFNSVLLNYYRTERDSVAWHADDEPELGPNPVIGSVSLGATRRFLLKHKRNKELPQQKLLLAHGSYLLMKGPTQHHWLHQVPKETKPHGPRINLTFRVIE
jgi:alkylated DNA repair dioxygenase AlkB